MPETWQESEFGVYFFRYRDYNGQDEAIASLNAGSLREGKTEEKDDYVVLKDFSEGTPFKSDLRTECKKGIRGNE